MADVSAFSNNLVPVTADSGDVPGVKLAVYKAVPSFTRMLVKRAEYALVVCEIFPMWNWLTKFLAGRAAEDGVPLPHDIVCKTPSTKSRTVPYGFALQVGLQVTEVIAT